MRPRDPGDWTPLIKARKRPNPLDYVDGRALGRYLAAVPNWPKDPPRGNTGPPITIPNPRPRRRR